MLFKSKKKFINKTDCTQLEQDFAGVLCFEKENVSLCESDYILFSAYCANAMNLHSTLYTLFQEWKEFRNKLDNMREIQNNLIIKSRKLQGETESTSLIKTITNLQVKSLIISLNDKLECANNRLDNAIRHTSQKVVRDMISLPKKGQDFIHQKEQAAQILIDANNEYQNLKSECQNFQSVILLAEKEQKDLQECLKNIQKTKNKTNSMLNNENYYVENNQKKKQCTLRKRYLVNVAQQFVISILWLLIQIFLRIFDSYTILVIRGILLILEIIVYIPLWIDFEEIEEQNGFHFQNNCLLLLITLGYSFLALFISKIYLFFN